MENSEKAVYQSTSQTPAPETYRGQRSLVLAALKAHGGKATLDQLVATCEKSYATLPRKLTPWNRDNGGVRFSVIWHLRQMSSDGLIKVAGTEVPSSGARVAKTEPVKKEIARYLTNFDKVRQDGKAAKKAASPKKEKPTTPEPAAEKAVETPEPLAQAV